jgi:hypothetical protein
MVSARPQWYDEKDDHSPWIKALAEVRLRATRHRATVSIQRYRHVNLHSHMT